MTPRSIANSSGFPLQLRIAHEANSSSRWNVLFEEHPWHSSETNNQGFIDLILLEEYRVQAMVIECKRVRQASWVFMIPTVNCRERTHVRLWTSDQSSDGWRECGWTDCQSNASYEAKYCAIPGQEQGRRNLLERTASELLESTESFALQEKVLEDKKPESMRSFRRIYIPVIVTTAELKVSCFDPQTISLDKGELPDNTEFTTIPYIRFRKSFTNIISPDSPIDNSRDFHMQSERCVFIVNAENFNSFLESWDLSYSRW